MTPTMPKKGRPVLPAEKLRSARFSVSLTPEQKIKFIRMGGSKWLQKYLSNEKHPQT